MLNFRPGTALPTTLSALMLFFASGTFSAAQTTFDPPPIPTKEPVEVITEDAQAAVTTDSEATPPPPPPQEEEALATPPPPPPAEKFFVSTDGSSEGPFTLSELQTQLAAGMFSATTYVWQDGMAEWLPAGEVSKLDALLAGGGSDATTTADADIDTFLVGVWVDKNSTLVPGLGQVQLDMLIEYYPDNTMDGIGTFTADNNGTTSVYDVYFEGTWKAHSTGSNTFDIVSQNEVSIGLVESPVYTDFFDMDDSVSYERVDQNTYRDVAENLTFTRY